MKLSTVFLGGLASLSSAHSDPREAHAGIPQLIGARQFLSELKARHALPEVYSAKHIEKRQPTHNENADIMGKRQSTTTCGAGVGTCASNLCCSAAGYCGTGTDYCAAPDCQFLYGPKCDANQIPAGASTASIARPLVGSVPYGGSGIYDCSVPGDIALTFDDGPYTYTSDLLDKLKVYNAKATFFITGNNLGKGAIDSTAVWANLIKRMVAEGHQVASHTWSHQDLVTLDATHFNQQIVYNEMAFRNILGYFPTYMRPPYSSCNAACDAKLKTLGYHITYFDLDTAGYLNDSPTLIQNSKNIWDKAITPSNPASDSFLQIEHDIHYQTVYNLTDYMLASMYAHGYKGVTTGECLGDPAANWYRSGGGGTTTPVTQTISTDGSCNANVTCQGSTFGNCCSQYGFCGATTDYCGTNCQPASGSCGSSSSTSSAFSEFSSVFSASSSTELSVTDSTSLPSSSTTFSNLVIASTPTLLSSSIGMISSPSVVAPTTSPLLSSSASVLSSISTSFPVSSSSSVSTAVSGCLFASCASSDSQSSSIVPPISPFTSLASSTTSTQLSLSLSVSDMPTLSTTRNLPSSSTSSTSSTSSASVAIDLTTLPTTHSSITEASSSMKSTSTTSSTTQKPSSSSSSTKSSSTSQKPSSSSSSTKLSSTSQKPTTTSSSSLKSSSQSSSKLSTSSLKISTTSLKLSLSPSSSITSTSKRSSSTVTTSTKAATSTAAAQAVSTDGSCSSTITCLNSAFGNCCSQYGWCGNTVDYCGTGCKPASGTCTVSSLSSLSFSHLSSLSTTSKLVAVSVSVSVSVSGFSATSSKLTVIRPSSTCTPSSTPTPKISISTDGSCGGTKRYTCSGSRFGGCCSSGGRCGFLGLGFFQPFCGVGCQTTYGFCI